MKKLITILFLLMINSFTTNLFAEIIQENNTISSGGGHSSNDIYTNFGVIGNPIIGSVANDDYKNIFTFFSGYESSLPIVETFEVTNISAYSGKSGGVVIDKGGTDIIDRGICWNTLGNPTKNDFYTAEGPGLGEFTSTLTSLEPSTTYFVRAYATNSLGTAYSDEKSFTTLKKTSPPEALCKDITVELDENGFASITAEDIDDGSTAESGIKSLEIDKSEFDCDDVGEVIVTLTVTDENDETATCEATVTVVDNAPPTITVSVSPTTLWPPNKQMKAITATVEVDDNCSGTTYELTSITSNENIANDVTNASYGTDDLSFDLRAWRNGNGTGRVYTITYTATDASGNETTAEATVTVPHDQSKSSLYNDGSYVNIYPNPAEDVVSIEVKFAEQSELSIRLLNALGEELFSLIKPGVNSLLEHIDISRFPSGLYIVEIKIGGEILHEKIIKKY